LQRPIESTCERACSASFGDVASKRKPGDWLSGPTRAGGRPRGAACKPLPPCAPPTSGLAGGSQAHAAVLPVLESARCSRRRRCYSQVEVWTGIGGVSVVSAVATGPLNPRSVTTSRPEVRRRFMARFQSLCAWWGSPALRRSGWRYSEFIGRHPKLCQGGRKSSPTLRRPAPKALNIGRFGTPIASSLRSEE
jgi:hypothetical protein